MQYPSSPTQNSTRERVAAFIEKGLSVRKIADLEGISTQAVYKHLKDLELPPPTTAKAVS